MRKRVGQKLPNQRKEDRRASGEKGERASKWGEEREVRSANQRKEKGGKERRVRQRRIEVEKRVGDP